MSGLVCSIIFQLFVHVDLGDYDRAASQFPDSSFMVPRSTINFAVPTTERSSYLCGWSKHRPHKHFILKDFPGGPLRGWSTIIYPFSDFILKDFPGGPSHGASQLILCFHHPLRSQLCFGQANVSLRSLTHRYFSN